MVPKLGGYGFYPGDASAAAWTEGLCGWMMARLTAAARRWRSSATGRGDDSTAGRASAWLNHFHAQMVDGDTALLYKRVDQKFRTRPPAGKKRALIYQPGSTVEAPDWDSSSRISCGQGLHFCATPSACDKFSDGRTGRYVACAVSLVDIAIRGNKGFDDKVRARRCRVLYECDRDGEPIEE